MRTYLEERAAAFPGLTLAQSYIRSYPYGSLAAQLLGYDGQIPQGDPRLGKDGYQPGDVVGLTGIERGFDRYLRGVPGLARVRVDSLGRPRSPRLLTTPPTPGQTVRLTINARLQVAAQNALQYGIQLARNKGNWACRRRRDRRAEPEGRLDPRAGFLAVVQPVGLQRARDDAAELAAQGLARRSTALAQELSGARPRARRHVSAGLDLQAAHRDRRSRGAPDQAVRVLSLHRDVHRARGHLAPRLAQLGPLRRPGDGPADGDRAVVRHVLLPPREQVLLVADGPRPADPDVGRARFGFGQTSGTDLTPQASGLVPTIGYAAPTGSRSRTTRTGRSTRLWKPGDSLNLAIGQGDLTVTPLQMARFYAAIANGGKLVTPHVLMDVENPNKTIVPTAAPPAPKPIPGLDPA